MQPAADLQLSCGLGLFAGKREDQQRRLKKITVEVISDSLRKIHKMESRDMTSWWSLGNGSPASHNWNNGAGCQKSRRHIMHIRATNVRGSIDRKNGRLMTEMEHFIRKPESSLYGRSLFRCNTLWWKTSSSSPHAVHLEGWPFPELLIRGLRANAISDPLLSWLKMDLLSLWS